MLTRRTLLAAAALVATGGAAQAATPSVDRIVTQHVRALGGMEAIRAIHGYIKHGTYNEGEQHFPTYTAMMRPFYRVIGPPEDTLKHLHEGYDGSAWEYYPDPGIVVRTVGAAAATTRHTAYIDDVLVDPKGAGTTLESGGETMLSGKQVYVVHATLADGFREDVYVDPKSWMIAGYARTVPFHAFGENLPTHIELGDYRPEGGVMMAHSDREIDTASGRILDYGTVVSVEINPALPLAQFSPPEWERTPLQRMIQRLYDERTDAVAVMATYRDFRTAFPDMASGDAVDFTGYQMLKTGETESALALLTQNVADNPNSARAHFGLGRALDTAGKKDAARAEYERALAIDPNFIRARTARDALK
ncbi:MAG: tetratricopeptide repeat protein [Alphaproteobacteria bacterium]|nr:tetratricopeptide repeat protein [Alphaproteobacteria bacterium]